MFVRTHLARALVFGLAVLSTPVLADEDDDKQEEVTVTAYRVERPTAEAGASVTVLDEDAIRKAQEIAVLDLLRQTPGVTVSRNGAIGAVSTLRIRGAEAGQTLVLIDGIKVNDLSTPAGEFNFANLTTANIERIEVLRGPESTLYGSDAIGGVVNIVTKTATEPFQAGGSVEAGSFGTVNSALNLGVKQGRFTGDVAFNAFRTDGISAADSHNGNTERDKFRTVSGQAKLRYDLSETLSADGFVRFADSRTEYDFFDFLSFQFVDGDGVTDSEELIGAAGLAWKGLDGKIEGRARVSWANAERLDSEFAAPAFYSDSKNRTVDLLATFHANEKTDVIVGGQFQANRIETEVFGLFASTLSGSANINGVFSEISYSPRKNIHLTAGVRHDDHELFGGHTTFRFTANFRVEGTGTIVRANWGEGFKAPTLFQLLSAFGDPALKPEQATGWEIGAEQPLFDGWARVTVTYFYRKTTNQIDFDLMTFKYGNIARSRAKGIEVIFSADVTNTLTLSGNYTRLDAIDLDTGLQLPRRPKNVFNATLSWQATGNLFLAASLNNTGRQIDGIVTLQSFRVVDVRASYKIDGHVSLYGRIENALDAQYQEVAGFGTPGLSGYVGIRGDF